MADTFLYDVFLSHNAKDKPRVRRLAQQLRDAGLRVWFDEWNVKSGDIITLKIDDGLEQSRVLVLCVSENALASGWVALERSTAIHRDPSNEDRRFIPLLLTDCQLPATLRRYKYVDFRDESEDQFMELLSACRPEDSESQPAPPPTSRMSRIKAKFTGAYFADNALPNDRLGPTLRLRLRHKLSGHDRVITRLSWAPDGVRLASAGQDGVVRIWNTDTGDLQQELSVPALRVSAEWTRIAWTPAWSPDGRVIACAYGDSAIRLWDVMNGKILTTLQEHQFKVNNVAWSNDGKTLASGADDCKVKLWDVDRATCLATLVGHESGVNNVAWQPNGQLLASASLDGTVRLWDTGSHEFVRELLGHEEIVITVAWSLDGELLASSSGDGTIRLWDPKVDQQQRVLQAHSGAVSCITFSADGELLASKGIEPDSTVRIWDTNNWELLTALNEPASSMWFAGIAFHPTKLTLATLDRNDTAIRIWDLKQPWLSDELGAGWFDSNG